MVPPAELEPVSKRIDRAAIQLYAKISDDFNPLHLDPEFAATTPMKGIIAHGMLSLNLIWQSLRRALGDDDTALALDVRFVRPVREDDVVTAGGARAGEGYDVWVRNHHGETVIAGRAEILAGGAPTAA
jgi:acyl dehydratase